MRGAYTREVAKAQVAGLSGGARAQKAVEMTLAELGIHGPPKNPTRAICGAWLALRAEVIEVNRHTFWPGLGILGRYM